jgi:CubicO group peptidase (beta-lactamase class C family)
VRINQLERRSAARRYNDVAAHLGGKLPIARDCLLLLLVFAAGCSHQNQPASFPNASVVKRLDGSSIGASEIDATVHRLMSATKVTGLGLAILNDGNVVYLKGYGQRDRSVGKPLTPDSIMSAASFTKVAFAYLVMKLVQDHIIDLDKPAYQYLGRPIPEIGDYADLAGDDRWKQITPRMLLAHTSGLPNWRRFTEDRRLHINFAPGTRFAYSGEGVALLQRVVEAATNRSLEDLMKEKVFKPFAMTRSSMTWHLAYEENHADGYDEAEKSLGPQRRIRADAAGSMKTTPRDFALFLQAAANGQGLRPEILELMLTPQIDIKSRHEFPTLSTEETHANDAIRLSYGLGWGLYFTPQGEAFFKEGHDDGWRNYCVYFRKPRIGIVIMTNSSNGESIYQELLQTLQKNNFTPTEWEGFLPYDAK